jgi:hypothetical protein
MSEIALGIAALPKENKNRSRIVIITQGKDDVIIAQDGHVPPVSRDYNANRKPNQSSLPHLAHLETFRDSKPTR